MINIECDYDWFYSYVWSMMCVTLKYSVDKHLVWVDTTKSAHMNGHWKYDLNKSKNYTIINSHIRKVPTV